MTFFKRSAILEENGRFAFLSLPLGVFLGATYDDRFRLIGKRVVDFLLSVNWTFFVGITAEALRAIIGSKSAIRSNGGRLTQNWG